MRVDNAHSRVFPGSRDRVGKLIDSLSGTNDYLWPHERWPAMQFDRPLGVGANGGHGPIRYRVVEYEASRWVRFTFTRPKGFHGYHEWEVLSAPNGCELRHALAIETTGLAVASWPLIWRPMHDALIEDALDKAARQLVAGHWISHWPWRVRTLRRTATLIVGENKL